MTAPSRSVPFDIRHAEKNVMTALVQARNIYGGKRQIIVDGDERVLSYDDILKGSFAIGSALRKYAKKGEAVGVLLPTGVGSVIGFFALHAFGRVPAMLNFTSGERGLKAACKAAQIKTVITAHKFVEVGKFEDLIAQMQDTVNFVYLEDVREKLSLFDKLHAIAGVYAPWAVASRRKPDDVGVILFTSGTEGEPKGVVLSHRNLLANVEQVRAHVAFHDSDIVFNPLPTFHCFGLTVGSLMPLIMGLKSVQHPSPLQARTIATRVRESGSTILLATDTFISQYARAGDQGDLNSLRLAVCGAERVRDETRAMIRKKYSIEILEGYGVTEAAPVVSANQVGANKTGTVGRLLQGMEHRLEPVEGIPNAGRLHVRGPNVMLGYLRPDQPGVVQPLPEGWHDTGDVVSVDKDGYIAIRGRLKRFAKIGGEMVSLAVVENCASAIWPDHMHAAVALSDDRKGEQIILVTDAPQANRGEMIAWARNHGVPELAVPRHIVQATSVPVLGTGKTDYVRVKDLAVDGLKPAPVLTVVQQAAETPKEPPAGPAAE